MSRVLFSQRRLCYPLSFSSSRDAARNPLFLPPLQPYASVGQGFSISQFGVLKYLIDTKLVIKYSLFVRVLQIVWENLLWKFQFVFILDSGVSPAASGLRKRGLNLTVHSLDSCLSPLDVKTKYLTLHCRFAVISLCRHPEQRNDLQQQSILSATAVTVRHGCGWSLGMSQT